MKAWIASLATPFLTGFAAASVSVAQPVPVSRPNILFIMADLGRPEEIGQVFTGFQRYLYQPQVGA